MIRSFLWFYGFYFTRKLSGFLRRNWVILFWYSFYDRLSCHNPIRNVINQNSFSIRKFSYLSHSSHTLNINIFLPCWLTSSSSSAPSSSPTTTALNTASKKPLENSKSETTNHGSSPRQWSRAPTKTPPMKLSTFWLATFSETTTRRSRLRWLPQSHNNKSEKENFWFNFSCPRAGLWTHCPNLRTQESTWEWFLKESSPLTDTTVDGQRDCTTRRSWRLKWIWEELGSRPREKQSGLDTIHQWPQVSWEPMRLCLRFEWFEIEIPPWFDENLSLELFLFEGNLNLVDRLNKRLC